MQFHDLKAQYLAMKEKMDKAIAQVFCDCNFISGKQVSELEQPLQEYIVLGVNEKFIPNVTIINSSEV